MARTAFVTGDADAAAAATAVLTQRGWQVVDQRPGVGGIDCYVQMPWGSGVGSGPRADGLFARVDLLAHVASRLERGATVLLAVDDGDPAAAPISPGLLEALARVVLEDAGHEDARVAVLPADDLTGVRPAPKLVVSV